MLEETLESTQHIPGGRLDNPINLVRGDKLAEGREFSWIAKPIVPLGLTLVVGDRVAGTTTFCLGLATGVATGAKVFNRFPVDQSGNVLYFALEESEASLKKKLDQLKICPETRRNIDFVAHDNRPGYLSREGERAIRRILDSGRHSLVVIDTLMPLMSKRNRKQTDLHFGYEEGLVLRGLRDDYGIAIVTAIHTKKSLIEEETWAYPIETVFGSGFSSFMDSSIVLQRFRRGSAAFVHALLKSAKSRVYRASFSRSGWKIVGMADALNAEDSELLSFLENKFLGVSFQDIEEFLGVSESVAVARVERLSRKGYAYFCEQRGGWAPVPEDLIKVD